MELNSQMEISHRLQYKLPVITGVQVSLLTLCQFLNTLTPKTCKWLFCIQMDLNHAAYASAVTKCCNLVIFIYNPKSEIVGTI